MLQAIRERAQGWIAWAIVLLISIPFALWGIQQYLGGGGEPVVAKVGGRKITQREFDDSFRRFRMQLRERLGPSFDISSLDDAKLHEQVLNSMIRSDVILQAAVDMGMRAGNDLIRGAIAGMPAFQVQGRFDRDAYERALRLQGLSPKMFEQQVRSSIVSRELSSGIQGSAFLTAGELRNAQQLRDQQRGLAYVVFRAADFLPTEPVKDADVTGYYRGHSSEFVSPERVKVAYLELDAKSLGATAKVSDQELQDYFDEHHDDFAAPEQRRARHILIPLAKGASADAVAKAQKKAAEILTRLKAGESFASLAKELSGDPGSAAQGGELGWFERGVMDPAFEKAVFAMKPGEVKGPVRSAFGLHIIQLEAVRPGEAVDLASVKDKVLAAVRAAKGERMFYDESDGLANLSYEHPDTLEPAAKALGLKVQESGWLQRSGNPGIFASSKVAAAAFSDDVLVQRYNSEPIELGPEHVLVLRVTDHQEESTKPLEKVREQIVEILRHQRAAERAREAGEALLKELRAGTGLQVEAAAQGLKLARPGLVTRDAAKVPPAILAEAFKLPKPAAGGISYGETVLNGGDFVVMAVDQVKEGGGQSAPDPRQGTAAAAAERARADGVFRDYVDYLKRHTEISITPRS